ncbi:MAG: ferrous iron transporter B, partial [Crocinitomicaceae bacterium]
MKVALLGNPNTGKTSVFNILTGLRQQVGNFPGVTVDRKVGKFKLEGQECELVDFPGTYSIYPRSKDEAVVYDVLSEPNHEDYPDVVAVVIDRANLERNLLFFTQVYDLQLPTVMILNMSDLAQRKEVQYDLEGLKALFPEAIIVESNARIKSGKERIEQAIVDAPKRVKDRFIGNAFLSKIDDLENQERETELRFSKIRSQLSLIKKVTKKETTSSEKIDRILVHPIFGYLIFAAILMVIFQFIYAFSSIPMDLIDSTFANLSEWVGGAMPEGVFNDLLTEGIIPGIGGVVIFIPQIALLFFFIALLEETGYLARVVFIMDRIMRPLGLNGKSVVPLMSSVACAIPGVMAARTISDWKERMITIMVAPLMSCSARIPVYTLLIAIVIPNETVGGIFGLQGLVLFGLYALGTVGALLVALILKLIIRTKDK